jgi:hypothetical protein
VHHVAYIEEVRRGQEEKKIAYLLHFRQFVVEEPVATREDLVVGR